MLPLLLFTISVLPTADQAPVVVASMSSNSSVHGVWPVRPAEVISGFDPPAENWDSGHRGIDLATSTGIVVMSAADGIVTFANSLAGRGVVVVDHGSVRTTYEPVHALVTVGDWVSMGDELGTIETGTGHCGDGSCLHWGLRRDDNYLDPRLLLGLRPVLKAP